VVPTLFVLPVIALFFYDAAQNFYRTFFLNLVLAIALTVFLSRSNLGRIRQMALLYFGLCEVVVVASLSANWMWFRAQLRDGYEGPSISRYRDWLGVERDVNSLVHACNIDLSKGRIIVDDMTYNSFKYYPDIYPITYLSLQAALTKMGMAEVIARVRPNYAVVRCSSLETPLEAQYRHGELCCLNLVDQATEKQ
jgi:hypothetical protein